MPLNKKAKRANWVPCSPNDGMLRDDTINTLQSKSPKSSLLLNFWQSEFLKLAVFPSAAARSTCQTKAVPLSLADKALSFAAQQQELS